MDKKSRQQIFSKREIIKYNASRAYFGKLTSAALSEAYAIFKHTQDWDKPVIRTNVNIGKIDGGVICSALWYEMSYNPARFGKVSPFEHDGAINIYRFCRNGVPENTPGFEVIERIRHKMIDFMVLNGRSKNKWYDNIETQDGRVIIEFIDGHSDDTYKVLSMLRKMIRMVTNQNQADFNRQSYRDQMLTVIHKRHPNGIREDNKPAVVKQDVFPADMTPEEREEDRLDKAEESAQITSDNRKYVPFSQYKQARSELARVRDARANEHLK